jgi:O-antigen/teichoic acid export membrane protein
MRIEHPELAPDGNSNGTQPTASSHRLWQAAKGTLTTQGFNGLRALLSLVAVPLYLTWLGAEGYGLVLTVLALRGYLMFADAGVGSAALLHIAAADGRGDSAGVSKTLRASFLLAGTSSLVVALSLVLVATIASVNGTWVVSNLGSHAPSLLLILGIDVIVTLLSAPSYALFLGMQQSHISATYQGIAVVGGMSGGLLGVWLVRVPEAILIAGVVCNACAGCACYLHGRIRYPWAYHGGSWRDWTQLRFVLRSATKSFGAQIGAVLCGSAPILAISWEAGPKAVPLFTIPLTLLGLAISPLQSFNAVLQSSFGEASARGDHAWNVRTIESILRRSLVFLSWLAVGYFFLAQPVIVIWTSRRLAPSKWMLLGVIMASVPQLLLGTLRAALTGINRHRHVASSSIVEGLLCFVIAAFAVHYGGPNLAGYAAGIALCATSGWIIPLTARTHLPGLSLRLPWSFQLRLGAAVLGALAAGMLATSLLRGPSLILGGGLLITLAYGGLLSFMMPEEFHRFKDMLLIILRRKRPS